MRRIMTVLVLGVLVGCVAAGGTASESIATHDEYVEVVASLTDLLERATYLAITGFSAYDAADQLVAAQELVNLFEGPGGPNYESQTTGVAAEDELGILARFESLMNADASGWPEVSEETPYSQFTVYRDVSWNTEHFLRLSYVSALEALRIAYSLIGPKDAFRTSYACLLAARGGFDDPFLVAGVQSLQDLLSVPEGRALHVDSIQAAIDALPDGGTLQLESGTYREPVVITKSVTILGATQSDRESGLDGGTVLEGVAWESVISVVSDEPVIVVIEDLTIRDGRTAISLWLTLDQPNVTLTLKNVTFLENGTGLALGKGTVATCVDCRFEGNDLAVRALAPDEGAQASFTNCVFEGNDSTISAYGNQLITLDACLIQNGIDPDGDISLAGAASFEMRNSELHRASGRGIILMDTASMTLINNVIETVDSHAIAVASGGTGLENPVARNCGVSMGVNETELPLGTIAGRGNTIIGGVCPEERLLFLTEPAPAEISVVPGQSIQAAIETVADGGVITIEPGKYHENLDISRSLTLVGSGRVTLTPFDRTVAVIAIEDTDDVVVQNLRIEAADKGIEAIQSSCTISECWIHSTGTDLFVMSLDLDRVLLQDCTFTSEGVGVNTLGNGIIELTDCQFLGPVAGALLAGMTSVLVQDCAFEDCGDSIVLSSTVNTTLTGNRITGSLGSGIRVAAVPFDAPDGLLSMIDNVIRNSMQWGISFCTNTYPFELTFEGEVEGFGNIIEGGHGYGPLCPTDYEWPVGFFAEDE